jgi:hypothetical protein
VEGIKGEGQANCLAFGAQAVSVDITDYLRAAGDMRMRLAKMTSVRLVEPWQSAGSSACLIELYVTPEGIGHPASIWLATESGKPNWLLSDFLNEKFHPADAKKNWEEMTQWLETVTRK